MITRHEQERQALGDGWLRWGLTVLLGGYLLFAHPCHSNEDTELHLRFWIGTTADLCSRPL